MTDDPQNSDNPISNPLDPHCDDNIEDDDFVEAMFIGGPRGTATGAPSQPYDLSWLFLCWAWERRIPRLDPRRACPRARAARTGAHRSHRTTVHPESRPSHAPRFHPYGRGSSRGERFVGRLAQDE